MAEKSEKLRDMKDRSRRNNLRIDGLNDVKNETLEKSSRY